MKSVKLFTPSAAITKNSAMPAIFRLQAALEEFSEFYKVKPKIFPHLLLPAAEEFHYSVFPILKEQQNCIKSRRGFSQVMARDYDDCLADVTFYQRSSSSNYVPISGCWLSFSYRYPSGDPDIYKNYHSHRELAAYCRHALSKQPVIVNEPQQQIAQSKQAAIPIHKCESVQIRIPVDPVINMFLPVAGHVFLPLFMKNSVNQQKFQMQPTDNSSITCENDSNRRGLKFRL